MAGLESRSYWVFDICRRDTIFTVEELDPTRNVLLGQIIRRHLDLVVRLLQRWCYGNVGFILLTPELYDDGHREFSNNLVRRRKFVVWRLNPRTIMEMEITIRAILRGLR